MMYWALLAGLSFACFFFANAVLSGIAVAIASRARGAALPSRQAANVFFALRTAPALLALCFVLGIGVPAFLRHEPAGTNEQFSLALAIATAMGGLILTGVVSRALVLLVRTRMAVRIWQQSATQLSIPGVRLPIWCLDDARPRMTVVGLLHPRLFVSKGALNLLRPSELQAAIAHEEAHHHAGDIWRQFAVRVLPDLLPGTRAFADCERMFLRSMEEAADERGAVRSGRPVDLAAALVKFGKYAAPEPALLGAHFLSHEHAPVLAQRVHRLLATRASARNTRIPMAAITLAGAAVLLLQQNYSSVLLHMHHAMETLVRGGL
jgi:Zn-dependent protease with chaperone function